MAKRKPRKYGRRKLEEWTGEQKREIAIRYRDGASGVQLGAELRCSPDSIYDVLRQLGVELRPRPGGRRKGMKMKPQPNGASTTTSKRAARGSVLTNTELRTLELVAGVHKKGPKVILNALLQQEISDYTNGRSRLFGGK